MLTLLLRKCERSSSRALLKPSRRMQRSLPGRKTAAQVTSELSLNSSDCPHGATQNTCRAPASPMSPTHSSLRVPKTFWMRLRIFRGGSRGGTLAICPLMT